MTICILAAVDRRDAIGIGGGLPWHLPEDLKRFKRLTLGKVLLMGRRTAESLGRALPGRRNLVLSRGARVPFEGMELVPTLEEALQSAGAQDVAVIGGGDVFALALPLATILHMTFVETTVEGADAWFPPVDWSRWREVSREHHVADAKHAHAFDFVDYQRIVT